MKKIQLFRTIIKAEEAIRRFLFYICREDAGMVSRGVFWSTINTLITLGLLFFTAVQIREVNKTNQGEFLEKFRQSFITPKTSEIIMLMDYKLITYKINVPGVDTVEGLPHEFPSFERNRRELHVINKLLIDSTKQIYSSYEIDDYILGPFEDLGMYLKRGMVDIDEVYNGYGWYIMLIWEDKEIKKYIDWSRKEYESQVSAHYEYFEYVYNRVKEYEKDHPDGVLKKKNLFSICY